MCLFTLGRCVGAFAVSCSYFVFLQTEASVNIAAHLHQANWQEQEDLLFRVSGGFFAQITLQSTGM